MTIIKNLLKFEKKYVSLKTETKSDQDEIL